jgi:hypothetical protein
VTKRTKIEISKSDELQEVDLELEQAMNLLENTNQRIDDILSGFKIEIGAYAEEEGEDETPAAEGGTEAAS